MYNLGIRSDTSKEIAARWKAESAVRLPHQVKSVFVFCFGLNDATEVDGAMRVPLEASIGNARTIMREARALGYVLWIGPTPICEERRPVASALGVKQKKSNTVTSEYNANFRKIAIEESIPYLDLFNRFETSASWPDALSDGVHPSEAGYAKLAKTISEWDPWRELFQTEGHSQADP